MATSSFDDQLSGYIHLSTRYKMKNVLFFILTFLLLIGCRDSRWFREFELDEKTFNSEAMQMVIRDTGLDLPEGVRGLNFRYSPPIDPAFVARIEIPKEARFHVQKQIEAIKNQDIDLSGGPGKKVAWWPPPQKKMVIDRQLIQADGDYFRAALTQEDKRIILYVEHAVF